MSLIVILARTKVWEAELDASEAGIGDGVKLPTGRML